MSASSHEHTETVDSVSESRYAQFKAFREKLNHRILGDDASRGVQPDGSARRGGSINTRRFFQLDTKTYAAGALDEKTKELMGLCASMVLRCDDCIAYHIDQAVTRGASDDELWETFDIALIVGGSIVIPHLRRAAAFLDACRAHHDSHSSECPS